MKTFIFIIIGFASIISYSYSQQWSGNDNTTDEINRSGNVGIGVADPAFQLDVNEKIGIDGTQILYLPDQSTFLGSIVIGNGGANLTRSGGTYDGRYNFLLGFGAGQELSSGFNNVFIGTYSGNQTLSGNNNVGVGGNTLQNLSSGIYNVAIGTQSARNIQSGSYNVCIGRRSGYSISNSSSNVFIGYEAGYSENGSNKLYIENSNSSSPLIYGEFDNDLVAINGKLGIGTQAPGSYALYVTGGESFFDNIVHVNGKIWGEEIEVIANVTADHVFFPDYNLWTLQKVDSFIKDNGHLPEIPSADEMKAQGLNLGEMQIKLLQKIEELTLYIIQQEKRIKELELKIKNLY